MFKDLAKIIFFFFIFFLEVKAQQPVQQHTDSVRISVQYISDIDFANHEYKIEFWLKITSDTTDSMSLTDIDQQIAVEGAKELKVLVIPDWSNKPNIHRKTLKVICTMVESWDLDGYPFDKQKLDVKIYNAGRSLKYFRFAPYDNKVHYKSKNGDTVIETENGWMFANADVIVSTDTVLDPFGDRNKIGEIKKYSAINYHITLFRTHPWWLFVKLLLGMYVAFFVAFTALFLSPRSSSRLELPVGGMFAAIANKYIIESILPQSPQFSLVDKLHSVTIVSILFILVYAVYMTHVNKAYERKNNGDEMPAGLNNMIIVCFFLLYLVVNVTIIIKAL